MVILRLFALTSLKLKIDRYSLFSDSVNGRDAFQHSIDCDVSCLHGHHYRPIYLYWSVEGKGFVKAMRHEPGMRCAGTC